MRYRRPPPSHTSGSPSGISSAHGPIACRAPLGLVRNELLAQPRPPRHTASLASLPPSALPRVSGDYGVAQYKFRRLEACSSTETTVVPASTLVYSSMPSQVESPCTLVPMQASIDCVVCRTCISECRSCLFPRVKRPFTYTRPSPNSMSTPGPPRARRKATATIRRGAYRRDAVAEKSTASVSRYRPGARSLSRHHIPPCQCQVMMLCTQMDRA
jgi:hypothetical protein